MLKGQVTAVLCGDLNMVRCFANTGIATALVSSDAEDLTLHSRYCRQRYIIASPLTEPEQAVKDLLEIGRSLPGRPAIFYDSDPTLQLISRHRQVLAQYYRFLMPAPDLVEDMANKVRFADLSDRLNLPTPRTVRSQEVDSAADAAARLSLPCIFKPISHVGWYETDIVRDAGAKPFKALLASSPQEFQILWEKMSRYTRDFVVQEYIPGDDACIYSFHGYFNGNAEPLGCYVGRKIRTYPKRSGVSTYLELVKDPEVVELGMKILTAMKFVGPVKLDFKKDPIRNRFYLLESNPRFNLWHHLGAACGINLPLIAYQDLYGELVEPASAYRTGVRWLSFGNDLRAFVRDYHHEGDLSWAQWLWSLRGEKVHDVFSWRDPRPSAMAAARYGKAVWHKVIRHALKPQAAKPAESDKTHSPSAIGTDSGPATSAAAAHRSTPP